MILTCPSCSSRFMVADSALGEEGREVRCAKCQHEWHALPENDVEVVVDDEFDGVDISADAEEEAADDDVGDIADFTVIDDDDDAPASEEGEENDADDDDEMPDFASIEPIAGSSAVSKGNMPLVAGFIALCLCAMVLALLVGRHSLGGADSMLSPLYRMVGYTAEDGVMLADVVLEVLPSRRKKRYRLHCNIVNTMEGERYIPKLSMQIMSKDGNMLAQEDDMLELKQTVLKGGEHVSCGEVHFEAPSSRARTLVLNLGSPMELSLRAAWEAEESEVSK